MCSMHVLLRLLLLVTFMFLIVCVHCCGFMVIVFFIQLLNILNRKFRFEHIYAIYLMFLSLKANSLLSEECYSEIYGKN